MLQCMETRLNSNSDRLTIHKKELKIQIRIFVLWEQWKEFHIEIIAYKLIQRISKQRQFNLNIQIDNNSLCKDSNIIKKP